MNTYSRSEKKGPARAQNIFKKFKILSANQKRVFQTLCLWSNILFINSYSLKFLLICYPCFFWAGVIHFFYQARVLLWGKTKYVGKLHLEKWLSVSSGSCCPYFVPVLKCFSVCGVVTVGGLHCLSWADGRHYGGHLARHQHQPFSLRLVGHHSSSPSASHLAWNTKRFLVSLCSCLRTSFLGLATNSIFSASFL